jgi:class II lanthipeptide synthase
MQRGDLSVADLYAALTLQERAALVGDDPPPSAASGSLADRRLERWRKTPAFEDDASFAHFLACHGVDERRFRALLDSGSLCGRSRGPEPEWVVQLLARLNGGKAVGREARPGSEDADGFLSLVHPLVRGCRRALARSVRSLDRRFPGAVQVSVVDSLLDGLLDQLLALVIRPLVLEVNIARITGILSGATPAERLASFHRLLGEPSFRNPVFARYPVLARHCLRTCDQWLAGSRELLSRYCDDRRRITDAFGGAALGTLSDATIASGDPHHQGRRVIIATFSTGLRLVYKPRPMRAAAHFQAVLRWLNERGQDPPLRTIEILDRGGYGWAEYVEVGPCASAHEARRFYRRQGALLAVLHCLAGTDCHFENLVAAGADPVLIDVETLLQPLPYLHDSRDRHSGGGSPGADSVLAVGMLPHPVRVGGEWVDLSGLGASSSQPTPLETLGLEQGGTDEVRVVRTAYRTGEVRNRPTLAGSPVPPRAHAPDVEAGFSAAYELILESRRELLAPDGLLSLFVDAPVRVVLRSTAAYAALLNESFHPGALRDGAERERVLAQLWWGTGLQPTLRKAVSSEYDQMLGGDIPLFFSLPGSPDLMACGGERIRSVFATPGLRVAENRIRRMSGPDLENQKGLIRESMLSLPAEGETSRPPRAGEPDRLETDAVPGRG